MTAAGAAPVQAHPDGSTADADDVIEVCRGGARRDGSWCTDPCNRYIGPVSGRAPRTTFSDDKLRALTKEQLQELYDKYRKTNPTEANKVKKWQKTMGFRGSSVKKGGKAKKFLRKAGKGAKVIIPLLFLHDWYEGGFWNATKNTANDLTWPLSELWN